MSRKLELLLREWGDFVIKNMEHADLYGENILYRAGIMGGRVQSKGDGHKILCADMPRHLQRVDIALKRIPKLPAYIVRVAYCCPINTETQKNYTKGQLAALTRMSLTAFEQNLNEGKRQLSAQLYE